MAARSDYVEEIKYWISRGEWQENKRMRVDGKNLEYVWIWEPVNLKKGESRAFRYALKPYSEQTEK